MAAKHQLNDGKQKSTCKKHTTTKHFEEGQVNQTTTRNKRENNARERMLAREIRGASHHYFLS